MDAEGSGVSPSGRWTCEACGCNTNPQADRSCTICGTSNSGESQASAGLDFWERTPSEGLFGAMRSSSLPHTGPAGLRRGPGFVGRPAWLARDLPIPQRRLGLGMNGINVNEELDMDDEELWESVADSGEIAGDDLESLAMELSGESMARSRFMEANRQRFFEAARAFSQAQRETTALDPVTLLQYALENAPLYQPKWIKPTQLTGRNRGSNGIEVGDNERQNLAHLPLGGAEGRTIRSEEPLPRDTASSVALLQSHPNGILDRRKQKVWGFRVAFDNPARETGGNMGGCYLVGVASGSFTAYGDQSGLQQSPFFWGIEDGGRKYEGTRQPRAPRRLGASNFAIDLRTEDVPFNEFQVVYGAREIVTVVADLEARSLTFWRNETLLGTLITNLPRSGLLFPVAVPFNSGSTVVITGLNNDPLPLLRSFASDWRRDENQKIERNRKILLARRGLYIVHGEPSPGVMAVLRIIFNRYLTSGKDTLTYNDTARLWYRCGMKLSYLDSWMQDRPSDLVSFDDFVEVFRRVVHEDARLDARGAFCEGKVLRHEIGDYVELAEGFEKHGDASGGPLQVGDRGVVVEVQDGPNGERRSVRVLHSGRRWWYHLQAIQSERSGAVDTPAIWFLRRLVRAHGFDDCNLRNLDGHHARANNWRIGDIVIPKKITNKVKSDKNTDMTLLCGRVVPDNAVSSAVTQRTDSTFLAVEFIGRAFAEGIGAGVPSGDGLTLETRRVRASKLIFSNHLVFEKKTDPLNADAVLQGPSNQDSQTPVNQKVRDRMDAISRLEISAIVFATKECSQSPAALANLFAAGLPEAVLAGVETAEHELHEQAVPSVGFLERMSKLCKLLAAVANRLYGDTESASSMRLEFSDADANDDIASSLVDSAVGDSVNDMEARIAGSANDLDSRQRLERATQDVAVSLQQRRNLLLSLVSRTGRRGNNGYIDEVLRRDGNVFVRGLPAAGSFGPGGHPFIFGNESDMFLSQNMEMMRAMEAPSQNGDVRRAMEAFQPNQQAHSANSGDDIFTDCAAPVHASLNPLVSSFLNSVARGRSSTSGVNESGLAQKSAGGMPKGSFISHLIGSGVMVGSTKWIEAIITAQEKKLRSSASRKGSPTLLKGAVDEEGNSLLYLSVSLGSSVDVISQLLGSGAIVTGAEIKKAAVTGQADVLALLLSSSTDGLEALEGLSLSTDISDVVTSARTRRDSVETKMRQQADAFMGNTLKKMFSLILALRRRNDERSASSGKAIAEVFVGNVLLCALNKAQEARRTAATEDSRKERALTDPSSRDTVDESHSDVSLTNTGIFQLLPRAIVSEAIFSDLDSATQYLLLIEDYLCSKKMEDTASGLRLLSSLLSFVPEMRGSPELERFGFRELVSFHEVLASSRIADILSRQLEDGLHVSASPGMTLRSRVTQPRLVPHSRESCSSNVVVCPKNHTAVLHITKHAAFRCDLCGSGVERGRPMHGCRDCDWDACENCTDKAESGLVKCSVIKEMAAECELLLSESPAPEDKVTTRHVEMLDELCRNNDPGSLDEMPVRLLKHDRSAIDELRGMLDDYGRVTAHQFLCVILPALHASLVDRPVSSDMFSSRGGPKHRSKKARVAGKFLGEQDEFENQVEFNRELARLLVVGEDTDVRNRSRPIGDGDQSENGQSDTEDDPSTAHDSHEASAKVPELLRRLHQILSLYESVTVFTKANKVRKRKEGTAGDLHTVTTPITFHLVRLATRFDGRSRETGLVVRAEPLVQLHQLRSHILRIYAVDDPSYLDFCSHLSRDGAVILERQRGTVSWRLAQVLAFDRAKGSHVIRYASSGFDPTSQTLVWDANINRVDSMFDVGPEAEVILALREYFILHRSNNQKSSIPAPRVPTDKLACVPAKYHDSIGARIECRLPPSSEWCTFTVLGVRVVNVDDDIVIDVVSEDGRVIRGVPEDMTRHLLPEGSEAGEVVRPRRGRLGGEVSRAFSFFPGRRRHDAQGEEPHSGKLALRRSWSALSLADSMKPIDMKFRSEVAFALPKGVKPDLTSLQCLIGEKEIRLVTEAALTETPPRIAVTVSNHERLPGIVLEEDDDTPLVSALSKLGLDFQANQACLVHFSFQVENAYSRKPCSTARSSVVFDPSANEVMDQGHLEVAPWTQVTNRTRKLSARSSRAEDDDASVDLCDGLDQICIQCMEVLSLLSTHTDRLDADRSNGDHVTDHSMFENALLSAKLIEYLDDPVSAAGGMLPEWCIAAPVFAPRIFSYESRKLLLDRVAFGVSRAVLKQQEAKIDVGRLRQRMASLRARAVELVGEAFSGGAEDPTALQLQADELYGMEEALSTRVRAAFKSAKWREHSLDVAKSAVRRDELLTDARLLMERYANDPAVCRRRLEVRFEGESGFDAASGDEAGVTRGFYADVAEALLSCDHVAGVFCPTVCSLPLNEKTSMFDGSYKVENVRTEVSKLPIWIPDVDSSAQIVIPTPRADKRSAIGIYPRPIPHYHPQFDLVLDQFRLIGRLFAAALRDGFLFPLPLSASFFKLVLNGEMSAQKNSLTSFDLPRPGFLGGEVFAAEEYICKQLDQIDGADPHLSTSEIQYRYSEVASDKDFARKAFGKMYDCSFEDYFQDRTFVDPLDPTQSENAVPLCDKGHQISVTVYNVREWVALAKKFMLHDGVISQASAFRRGVEDFFSPEYLRLFTPEELQRDGCGSGDNVENWDEAAVRKLLKLDGGKGAAEALVAVAAIGGEGGAALSRRFGPSSPTISFLIKALLEAAPKQRRQFLNFVTSVPIETPGKIEVVPIVSPNGEFVPFSDPACLPRANTCARRLYLPKFEAYETFSHVMWAVVREESKFKGFYEWRG